MLYVRCVLGAGHRGEDSWSDHLWVSSVCFSTALVSCCIYSQGSIGQSSLGYLPTRGLFLGIWFLAPFTSRRYTVYIDKNGIAMVNTALLCAPQVSLPYLGATYLVWELFSGHWHIRWLCQRAFVVSLGWTAPIGRSLCGLAVLHTPLGNQFCLSW